MCYSSLLLLCVPMSLPLPQLEPSPRDGLHFPSLYHLPDAALGCLSEWRWAPLTEDPAHLGCRTKMI